MKKKRPALAVFTMESEAEIRAARATKAWKLDYARIRTSGVEWIVCVRRSRPGARDHRRGFLVGRIARLEPAGEGHGKGRWIIHLGELASIDVEEAWGKAGGGQYPVSYTTLEDLGIPGELPLEEEARTIEPLTIDEAKRRLAATFGVAADKIEIIIRA